MAKSKWSPPESEGREGPAGPRGTEGYRGAEGSCALGTMGTMAPHPLTVGFDLDMTLIDSRPGIKAAYRALSAETGTPIDVDLVVSRLGPPVEHELANWYPAHAVAAAADRYREIYPAYAITPSPALPGARESVAAIRARGGRTIVVTAKHTPNARLHLAHLGIEPDEVIGSLWAERKGMRCASTARRCTSATTPGTCAAPVPPMPCRSGSRRARATRTNCGRRARTSSSRTSRTSRRGCAPTRNRRDRRPSPSACGPLGDAAQADRTTPAAAIRNPTPISMHRAYAKDGNGSVPRNSGATVTSVARAPMKKTIAPTRTSRSPAPEEGVLTPSG